MKIENFFVGPPRTMTSKIMKTLDDHPQVATSNPKELKYFCYFYSDEEYLKSSYSKPEYKVTTAYCNPLNCVVNFARDRMCLMNSKANVFIGLRHPIKRIISHWALFDSDHMPIGRVKPMWQEFEHNNALFSQNRIISDSDYLPYTHPRYHNYLLPIYFECSMYFDILKSWMSLFSNVHIIDAEDNPITVIRNIFDIMGISQDVDVNNSKVHSIKSHNSPVIIDSHVDEFKERFPDFTELLRDQVYHLDHLLGTEYTPRWQI